MSHPVWHIIPKFVYRICRILYTEEYRVTQLVHIYRIPYTYKEYINGLMQHLNAIYA